MRYYILEANFTNFLNLNLLKEHYDSLTYDKDPAAGDI